VQEARTLTEKNLNSIYLKTNLIYSRNIRVKNQGIIQLKTNKNFTQHRTKLIAGFISLGKSLWDFAVRDLFSNLSALTRQQTIYKHVGDNTTD
jgi:hypothetical protein